MPHYLRQQKGGSVPYDPGDPGEPPTIESTSIEPLLSTLDELRLAIPTLTEQSQLHLQNELSDIVQRIQVGRYTAFVMPLWSGAESNLLLDLELSPSSHPSPIDTSCIDRRERATP